MRGFGNALILPIAASIISCSLLAWWRTGTDGSDIRGRRPGQDGVPTSIGESTVTGPRASAGAPVVGNGKPSALPGAWPGFRGPRRQGVVDAEQKLARMWPDGGPPLLWTIELGEGYAGAAVSGGCVYVLDYDEVAAADTLRCLSLEDGREVWRNSYPVAVTRNHGMSRTVPVIVDNHVITIGPRCHVACWDATSGDCHWLIDLVRDFGATEPRWYTGQCPLIDDGRLILAPCGEALMLAVDYRSGTVLWKSPNPRGWQMTHASVMPMDLAGQRSYVYCGSGGVAAVSSEGRLLWDTTEWPTTFATCPSPLVLPDGQIFLCSGYGRTVGSLMLRVQAVGDQFTAQPAFTLTPEAFNSEHHTPIFWGDHLYGVRKRGGGQLVCLDLQGAEQWNSGADRFGHGPYLIADGIIYVMDDHGGLTMAEASPVGYQRLGRYEVFADGHDAWGPMAMVQGRLLVRDMTRMACVDVAQR